MTDSDRFWFCLERWCRANAHYEAVPWWHLTTRRQARRWEQLWLKETMSRGR